MPSESAGAIRSGLPPARRRTAAHHRAVEALKDDPAFAQRWARGEAALAGPEGSSGDTQAARSWHETPGARVADMLAHGLTGEQAAASLGRQHVAAPRSTAAKPGGCSGSSPPRNRKTALLACSWWP
ncbi:MAG TPA: hypothetical protein VMV92_11700 [Streptosporangiaceae bacterium]|nr:hypothetical protein [Streptosporangiaceae bacterium]